jgi:hypothetical protein
MDQGRQQFIDLMVERAAAGEAAVKPAAAGGGGPQGQALRRLVRRIEWKPRDNAVELVRCRLGKVASGRTSANSEHVADLPLAARRGLFADARKAQDYEFWVTTLLFPRPRRSKLCLIGVSLQ